MRWRGRVASPVSVGIATILALGLLGTACAAPSGVQAGWMGRHVEVPSVPFPTPRSFAVDHELLDDVGCDACAELPRPEDARFFYGTLAMRSGDSLFSGTGPGEPWLGNLFLSGWFGGLYLKTTMDEGPDGPGAAPAPLAAPDIARMILDALRGGAFAGMDDAIGGLLRTARSGSLEEMRFAAAGLLLLMTIVHGYNRGYLEVVLDNPPQGVRPPPPLQCGAWLGCRTDSLPLQALSTLEPTAQRLETSADPAWRVLGDVLSGVDLAAVPAGRAVWSGLLGTGGFEPEGYAAIVDLSYGFLEMTEAAILALSEALVGDVSLGRAGLVLAAGLLLWSGSYLLGLTGDADARSLPALSCP